MNTTQSRKRLYETSTYSSASAEKVVIVVSSDPMFPLGRGKINAKVKAGIGLAGFESESSVLCFVLFHFLPATMAS